MQFKKSVDTRKYVRYNANRTDVLNIHSEDIMRTLISINRRHAVIAGIILAAIMILFLGAFAIRSKAGSPADYDDTVYYKYTTMYRVCDGDTLTSIAEQYMDDIHYSSVSEYVSEVRQMNQMYFSDEIKAGELISICYYSTEYK